MQTASTLPRKRRPAVQELEHGEVRIVLLGVGVDAGIGEAAEHLAVAGVGELQPVGAAGRGLAGRVAEDLPLLRHRAPEERHQRLAPGRGRVPPVAALQAGQVADAACFSIEQSLIGPAEQFLPAEAVQRDDENVLGLAWRLVGRRRVRKKEEKEQSKEPSMAKSDRMA